MRMMWGMACAVALLATQPARAAVEPPTLLVAISVDQFSTNLFNAYRSRYDGGLKRLQQGVLFPSTYHGQAATETCPGHATLLSGLWPAHSGIIANNWFDLSLPRADKKVYCVEDETVPGTDSRNYTVSLRHFRGQTLGDRMKEADPRSRVYSVAGKDRAAVLMGGHHADELWWWSGQGFASYAGRKAPVAVNRVNQQMATAIAAGLPAPALDPFCAARVMPVAVPGDGALGTAPQPLDPGAARDMRVRPELDAAVLDIAAALVEADGLGKGAAPDLLTISLSVTDYVGHRFGPGGPEMCAQMAALDAALGRFFQRLDATGVRYAVMLSADHGGDDLPERNRLHGLPEATRVSSESSVAGLNAALGAKGDRLVVSDDIFTADSIFGDLYVSRALSGKARAQVIGRAVAWLSARPDVARVFTREELLQVTIPKTAPDVWTLAERAAASFDPERSGDIVVLLKPHVTPIARPNRDIAATHGSPWDYDRRVPFLLWWPGVSGFEQPASIGAVDIMPTFAALIHLPVTGDIDGRCRDLDPGPGSTCP